MVFNIVLIPGFACSGQLMQPLADALLPFGRVKILELPAIGDTPAAEPLSLASLMRYLDEQILEPSLLIGWSLGGMLAACFAQRHPHKVKALVTLATNASFVKRGAYAAAMDVETNFAFNREFESNAIATLTRFYGLMVQGDSRARYWLKYLRDQSISINPHWQTYLTLLSQLDNREILKGFDKPCLHLLAEKDALVPKSAAVALRHLNPSHEVRLLLGCAHHFPLSAPYLIVKQMQDAQILPCCELVESRALKTEVAE
ncbi:MAG: alpha/beta fold hydrolase [Cellvibrio sp.]